MFTNINILLNRNSACYCISKIITNMFLMCLFLARWPPTTDSSETPVKNFPGTIKQGFSARSNSTSQDISGDISGYYNWGRGTYWHLGYRGQSCC